MHKLITKGLLALALPLLAAPSLNAKSVPQARIVELASSGPSAVAELKRIATEDTDRDNRAVAVHGVAKASASPAAERDFFKSMLKDGDTSVQLAAYSELAGLGDKSGHSLALEIMRNSAPAVFATEEEEEALKVLAACGDPRDIGLLKVLSTKRGPKAQSALEAFRHIELVQLPEAERLPKLIKDLDDPDINVRQAVQWELYRSPDWNTNWALRKYLREPGHVGYKEASAALNYRPITGFRK